MCGRFTLNIPPEVLAKVFDLGEIPLYELRYNIAPGQNIVCVRQSGDKNKLEIFKWGFAPGGSQDNSQSPVMFCSETVNENPVLSHAIKYGRCIIPASGFYEWLPTDNNKHPYYIRLANSSLIGFAGLWAQDSAGVETCCILTTEANEIVRPIHDRMPVILHAENYNQWLNSSMHDPLELQSLYKPYPSDVMVAYPVPELVNNLRFDSASCIVHM